MRLAKLKSRSLAIAMFACLLLAPTPAPAHPSLVEQKCHRLTMVLRERLTGRALQMQEQLFLDVWLRSELAEPSFTDADRLRIVTTYVDTHPVTRDFAAVTREQIAKKFLELRGKDSRVSLERTLDALQADFHRHPATVGAGLDISATESEHNEFFAVSIGGRRVTIDITKAYELIDRGEIASRHETFDITSWVPEEMGLRRNLGWDFTGPITATLPVHIDRDHARRLSPERLEVSGLILDYGTGQLVIDGNHRAARRYMDGKDTMDFIVISEDDLGKILRR